MARRSPPLGRRTRAGGRRGRRGVRDGAAPASPRAPVPRGGGRPGGHRPRRSLLPGRAVTGQADFLLLLVAALSLTIVATSRLASCVRASAMQGVALALLPFALWGRALDRHIVPVLLMSLGALAVKAVVIPILLSRAIREA